MQKTQGLSRIYKWTLPGETVDHTGNGELIADQFPALATKETSNWLKRKDISINVSCDKKSRVLVGSTVLIF